MKTDVFISTWSVSLLGLSVVFFNSFNSILNIKRVFHAVSTTARKSTLSMI